MVAVIVSIAAPLSLYSECYVTSLEINNYPVIARLKVDQHSDERGSVVDWS